MIIGFKNSLVFNNIWRKYEMIKAICLFYIFKFAPKVIDQHSNIFWHKAVCSLNKERTKTNDTFYLWKWWRIYIRDPHSYPITSHWTYSHFHPFCVKKFHCNFWGIKRPHNFKKSNHLNTETGVF